MAHQRSWSELSPLSRVAIITGAAIQFGLLGAALRDLRHRSDDEVNGPRRLWMAVCFINFVGPISYFVFGRRRQG